MPTLYELGWRQGSVVRHELPAHALVLAGGENPIDDQVRPHQLWAVVTQDCDLHRLTEVNNHPKVELRPLLVSNAPPQLGIRSRLHRFSRFRPEHLDADSLRPMISGAVMTAIIAGNNQAREDWLDEEDLAALKTWLGRRYNRPAVPEEYGELLGRIATAVADCDPAVLERIRSVFARVEPGDPPRYNVYALVDADGDPAPIESELADALLEVPQHLGVLDGMDALRADSLTLDMIESSYEVDASDLTWGAGAVLGA